MDLFPLWNSLRIALISSVIVFFSGIFCAYYVAKLPKLIKGALDVILTLPMVLPPTVVGYFLLMLLAPATPFGSWVYENWALKLVMNWQASVAASTVVAFPLMYRNARAAFEQVDVNLIYAGRTLGMSERNIFWKVVIPIAAPGLASGTVLSFARAIGEYGATSMLAGNILGKTRTISVAIASETAAGNYDTAGFWVAVIVTLSFVVVFLINLFTGRGIRGKGWQV